VPSRPDKAAVDPLLARLDGQRLVVMGSDADLAAVVLRLLRTERVADVAIGYVPVSPHSAAAAAWDLPVEPGRALDTALGGEPDRVPLIRDDNGGVLVGRGEFGALRGVGYCDDDRVLRGLARRVRVTPGHGRGLVVEVTHGGLFRRNTHTTFGRAFQLGCLPSSVVRDGVPHERAVTRWTWYRHTEDLRLVRGQT